MQKVHPDYYPDFSCIGSKCNHNCCIGWEIDIDESTAGYYRSLWGDFGSRMQKDIDFEEDPPHFILTKEERCPFLNSQNLCDIITDLGEEHLCTICSEHPRFHNELPGRVESGLGMCCEEAARIILSHKEPVTLITEGEHECEDEIIDLRDKIICTLQNRENNIKDRVAHMLSLCHTQLPKKSAEEWAELLRSLERLDEEWTQILTLLQNGTKNADIHGFDTYMSTRQTEYEQLLVYIIYRHFANAPDFDEAAARAAFAALCFELIHTIGAVLWTERNEFTFESQVELCRMFSCEIEYSDENLYAILNELYM